MFKNKAFFTILLIIAVNTALSAQETGTTGDAPAAAASDGYSTSVFLRYNITRPDYAMTPYYLGIDLGADMDFGGNIPVLNLAGLEFSGKYIFLNSKNEITDDLSESHYFSTGISMYIKTRLEKPVNMGIRAGSGSGWMISGEIDKETENNKRLNGIYLESGIFSDFNISEKIYLQTGFDVRKQYYFKSDYEYEGSKDIDPVDMGFIYIKAGLRL